jgi:hypothetical protein
MNALPDFTIQPQPDDTTCGPTCLQAIYAYYGDPIPLGSVIQEVEALESRGTLAVLLAIHALERGYHATIYTYNLHVFDPSWFRPEAEVDLAEKLRAQAAVKDAPRLPFVTESYLRFLELGGRLRFRELTPELVRTQLRGGRPILTGLSATYLYQSPREIGDHQVLYDDLRGTPAGHFVVLCGYASESREVLVADPLLENPAFSPHLYRLPIHRVLGAILLGVLTHDANLLILTPGGGGPPTDLVSRGQPTGTEPGRETT